MESNVRPAVSLAKGPSLPPARPHYPSFGISTTSPRFLAIYCAKHGFTVRLSLRSSRPPSLPLYLSRPLYPSSNRLSHPLPTSLYPPRLSFVDVTAQVTAMLPTPPLTLTVPATTAALGVADPAPGRVKTLKVRYGSGAAGAVMEKCAEEGSSLTIGVVAPSSPPPPSPSAPVVPPKPRVGGVPAAYTPSRDHADQPIKWESKEGRLWANGKHFRLKGRVYRCLKLSAYPREEGRAKPVYSIGGVFPIAMSPPSHRR